MTGNKQTNTCRKINEDGLIELKTSMWFYNILYNYLKILIHHIKNIYI
jgi:hypothetical protein